MVLVDLALRTEEYSGPQAHFPGTGSWWTGWCWFSRGCYLAYCGSRTGSPVDGGTLYVRSAWLITDRNTGPFEMP